MKCVRALCTFRVLKEFLYTHTPFVNIEVIRFSDREINKSKFARVFLSSFISTVVFDVESEKCICVEVSLLKKNRSVTVTKAKRQNKKSSKLKYVCKINFLIINEKIDNFQSTIFINTKNESLSKNIKIRRFFNFIFSENI